MPRTSSRGGTRASDEPVVLRVTTRIRERLRRPSAPALLLLAASCAGTLPVERAYDGNVVQGRFIEPAAYSAFLRGAMAEAAGDAKGALAAYSDAVRLDPDSAEAWARIGRVRCTLDPRDPRAREAIARVFALDGRVAGEHGAFGPCIPAARADVAAEGGVTRERLIARAVAAEDPAAAWDAVVAWARERDDVALEAMALGAWVAIDPSRRDAVAAAAEDLAGLGEAAAARAVAGAAFDASDAPFPDGRALLARRLAVDEAIVRGDLVATSARATRARMGIDEAAARALLHGQTALSYDLAAERARADPDDVGARLVLASIGKSRDDGLGARDPISAVAAVHARPRARVAAAVWVVFGRASVHAMAPGDARRALEAVDHDPIVAGDDDVSRAAVALALVRAIDEADLSTDGAAELRVIREDSAEGGAPHDASACDLRHQLLSVAMTAPKSKTTLDLCERLRRVGSTDRVVAAALALARLGSGEPIEPGAAAALVARDPGDPLLCAAALRLATKSGDATSAEKTRSALAAIVSGGAPAGPQATFSK